MPLWAYLLAAQLVDVAWALLVLAGIEQVRLDPSLPSNPLDLQFMPYTHSLAATAVWGAAAGLVAARVRGLGGTARAGVAVGLVVASHWGLDLVVHRPDLTLWGAPPKLGFALWDAPPIAFALEVALLVGAAAYCAVRGGLSPRGVRAIAIGAGGLVVLQTVVTLGPVPASVPVFAVSTLAVFLAVAYAGLRGECWAARGAG